MKTLLSLITRPPVPLILGTILLVLLIQFGLPALQDATGWLPWFSSSMANGLCFGVVFLVVGSIVLRKLQARAKARSIEAEIRAQGQEHLEALPPTGRSDMEELQQRFDEALESLRSSKLGRGALYALPWYVIIGPPGSGKTTAITESGLNFPFLKGKSQGRGIRGLGGTRNCDWWFTDQSILLDTAGRYTTQSEDRDEWLSFLGMIKRSRQQKPINGVVVAIAITDLLGATPEAIEQHAVTIRERIDELVKELEVVFPVYLMFTKCDLLDGFVESFGTLSKEQRAQVWGATLAREGREERKAADQFVEEFNLLCRRVDEERLRLLVPDQSSEKQRKVLSLSLQLRAAARPLGEFVGKLTEPNPYSEGSELRGFYFTSGTQEGAPIDFVMDKMSSALGLAPGAAASPMTDVEAKSYFLRDLFADVMYGDRELAHSSSGALRRQALVRGATVYGAAAVAAIGVAMCISGWLSTQAIYDEYEGASKELGINPAREAAPEPGDRGQFNEQRRALEEMLDAAGRWALFRPGVEVVASAKRDYATALRSVFLAPIQEFVAKELDRVRSAPRVKLSDEEVGRIRQLLIVYRALYPVDDTMTDKTLLKAALEEQSLWHWSPAEIGDVKEYSPSDDVRQHLGMFIQIYDPDMVELQCTGFSGVISDIQKRIDAANTEEQAAKQFLSASPESSFEEFKKQTDDEAKKTGAEALPDATKLRIFLDSALEKLRNANLGDVSTLRKLEDALTQRAEGGCPELDNALTRLEELGYVADAAAIERAYARPLKTICESYLAVTKKLLADSEDYLFTMVKNRAAEDEAWFEQFGGECTKAVDQIEKAVQGIKAQLKAPSGDGAGDQDMSVKIGDAFRLGLRGVLKSVMEGVAAQICGPLQDQWDRDMRGDVAAQLGKFPFDRGASKDVTTAYFKRLFGPGQDLDRYNDMLEWLKRQWPAQFKIVILPSPGYMSFWDDVTRIRGRFFASGDEAGGAPSITFKIAGFPEVPDPDDEAGFVPVKDYELQVTTDDVASPKDGSDTMVRAKVHNWAVGDSSSSLRAFTGSDDRARVPDEAADPSDWGLFRVLEPGAVEDRPEETVVTWTLDVLTKANKAKKMQVAISFVSDELDGAAFRKRFFDVRMFEDVFDAAARKREQAK